VLTYVARRVLLALPTLLGVATIVFLLVRLLPGDPASVIAGPQATEADISRIRHQLDLDQPIWLQYVSFLTRLVQGNLGISTRSGHTVVQEIFSRAPYTLELAVIASVIATLLGVGLGVLGSVRPNSKLDVTISGAAVFGISMPVYWLGLMLIVLFSIKFHEWHLGGLPAAGASDWAGFILPSTTLALFSVGLVARMTRSSMLEVLGQDYVRTARAKGMNERRVIYVHALRNSLIPLVTLVGLELPGLVSGALVVEVVFSWPGIGLFAYQRALAYDYTSVLGLTTFAALLVILGNLIADVVYATLDPRIRLA
jgi:ABC-type dipeptide/oligopeptide/nickel transport system permease component